MNFISDAAKIIFKFPFQQQVEAEAIGFIDLDLVDSRNVSERTEISTNPIEQGFINDNAIHSPTEITLTGRMSEFSLKSSILSANGVANATSLLSGKGSINRLQQAHDLLYQIRDRKQPITLKFPRKEYTNMFLVGLDLPNEVNDGKVLRFNLLFRQINIVSSQLVQIENPKIKTQNAKKKSDFGRQTTSSKTASIPTKPQISLWSFIKNPGGKF